MILAVGTCVVIRGSSAAAVTYVAWLAPGNQQSIVEAGGRRGDGVAVHEDVAGAATAGVERLEVRCQGQT